MISGVVDRGSRDGTSLPRRNPRATRPASEKRRMTADVLASLRKDPFAVQFLPLWFGSLLPNHSPLHDRLPWMNFRAIRWLRSRLRPTMNVFEYGAGGSTLFIARRVRRVTSIEHEPSWYDLVARSLREDGLSNCDLRLIPAEREPSLRDVPYGPASYTSMSFIRCCRRRWVREVLVHCGGDSESPTRRVPSLRRHGLG